MCFNDNSPNRLNEVAALLSSRQVYCSVRHTVYLKADQGLRERYYSTINSDNPSKYEIVNKLVNLSV